ncbi:uncharacterized protein LOC105016803 [Esox lucius]|uniref:uncharacterized protein LOC105016803 n=1 Tax=Esox lucius TaxID=8010 RepID=UPI0014768E2C|nr:uncharacterized protein LOC105016803 [Esox lucius]
MKFRMRVYSVFFVWMQLFLHFVGKVEPTGTTTMSANSPGPSGGERMYVSILVIIVAATVILTILIFGIVMLVLKRRVTPTTLNQSEANFQVGFSRNNPTCMDHGNKFDLGTAFSMYHQHYHLTSAAGVVSETSSTSSDDSSDNFAFGPNVRARGQDKDYINVCPEASLRGSYQNVLGAMCNGRQNSPGDDYENVKEQLREEEEHAGFDHVKTEEAPTRIDSPAEDRESGERDTGDDLPDRDDGGDGDDDDDDDDSFVNYTTVVIKHQNKIY